MKNRSQPRPIRQPVRVNTLSTLRAKVWLERDGTFVIGEGGVDLLRAIDRWQSLTESARAVGWSYRHAWGYLRNAEKQLCVPLVKTSPGKGSDRGTTLTAEGRGLLKRLDHARQAVGVAARTGWRQSARKDR